MLPKLELAPIRTYFRILAKVRRPSSTPSATTARSESSRIISAAARATPVAPSTDRPTSAALMPGASLTPSPINPTTSPEARRALTIRTFWSGDRRAKTSVSRTRTFKASTLSAFRSFPVITAWPRRPTIPARRPTTSGSSPDRITTRTPAAASLAIAAGALALGGSAKVHSPSKTRLLSSSTVGSRGSPDQGREATAIARNPCSARA